MKNGSITAIIYCNIPLTMRAAHGARKTKSERAGLKRDDNNIIIIHHILK